MNRFMQLLTTTALLAFSVTAFAADADKTAKSPHGIFDLLTNSAGKNRECWTNPAIDGIRWQGDWNQVQSKVDGPYDWSMTDAVVAHARKSGKQIGLSFVALTASPAGLEAAGCKFVQLSYGKVPWINDPVFLAKWKAFIEAVGKRYDGKIDYIAIGGLGRTMESTIGITDEDMKILDTLGGLPAWETAVKAITDVHAAAFLKTPFIFTAAKPYKSHQALDSLGQVLDDLAEKYPGRFGIMDCSLNAKADTRYLPHEYVKKYSATHPVGLQFMGASQKSGHVLGGTIAETLDAAVALGANFIEIYPQDGDAPENAELLKATSKKLPKCSTSTSSASSKKSPHGIFDLLTNTAGKNWECWANPAIDGIRWRGDWNLVQTRVDGPYDWAMPDTAVALARKHGKQIGLSFVAQTAPPAGLEAAGCKFVQLSYGYVPWINDPVFLAKWKAFIQAAGKRYDGKIDYIAMGGLGRTMESNIGVTDEDMKILDKLGGLSGWETAVKAITAAHAAAFLKTPFIFTAAKPYKSRQALDSLGQVLDELAQKYPGRFGIMDCSLSAQADTRYLPHEYVKKYSATNPVGLQFMASSQKSQKSSKSAGSVLGGTVAETLDAAVALGAHFIEIYPQDGDAFDNVDLLKATSKKLPK